MKSRCYYKLAKGFQYYGGKGITVCESWRNDFAVFLKDMGERPDGTSLDRIDNNKNYEPSNCRWSDIKTQNNNKTQRQSKKR